jgi:hypothetical protein
LKSGYTHHCPISWLTVGRCHLHWCPTSRSRCWRPGV